MLPHVSSKLDRLEVTLGYQALVYARILSVHHQVRGPRGVPSACLNKATSSLRDQLPFSVCSMI